MIKNHHQLIHFLSHQARWRSANFLSKDQYPIEYWQWLNDEHSLTEQLIQLSESSFNVEVLRQEVDIPLWHEQDVLGQSHHLATTVREVVLSVDAQPVVLARSIIPMSLIRSFRSGLTELGTKPLGHLLFTDGRVRVSRRQFTVLDSPIGQIYGRRTPYEYMGSVILVAEFYLPSLMALSS